MILLPGDQAALECCVVMHFHGGMFKLLAIKFFTILVIKYQFRLPLYFRMKQLSGVSTACYAGNQPVSTKQLFQDEVAFQVMLNVHPLPQTAERNGPIGNIRTPD